MYLKNSFNKFHSKILSQKNKKFRYKLLWFFLYAASFIYRFLNAGNRKLYEKYIKPKEIEDVFLISIGGITAGGSGKTPFIIYLAEKLVNLEIKIGISSRGYESELKSEEILEPGKRDYSPQKYGDEPVMLHTILNDIPLAVGSDRFKSIKKLKEKYPETEAVLLDDSFQHYKLKRDIDIVLLPYDVFIENDYLLPAGMLRETLPEALKRLDNLIISKTPKNILDKPYFRHIMTRTAPKYIHNYRTGKKYPLSVLMDSRVLTVSGIARNSDFINLIKRERPAQIESLEFVDHYDYNDFADYEKQIEIYKPDYVITTAKDFVKLSEIDLSFPIYVLETETEFLNKDKEIDFINGVKKRFFEWRSEISV